MEASTSHRTLRLQRLRRTASFYSSTSISTFSPRHLMAPSQFISCHSFQRWRCDEPVLTDNLCEALNDPDRRYQSRIPCDFQPETRELRRNPNGTTSYVARADIRVILGVPGTPHLVLEFKKPDGSTEARRHYYFDGLNRFVEGKYAVGHPFGVMCGFVCADIDDETQALVEYISNDERSRALGCIANSSGSIVTMPSRSAATLAKFDTLHSRPDPAEAIGILHVIIPCPKKATDQLTSDGN
jgi:hypothetical protein